MEAAFCRGGRALKKWGGQETKLTFEKILYDPLCPNLKVIKFEIMLNAL